MELKVIYNADEARIPLGTLSDRNNRNIFRYDESFRAKNINVCPLFSPAETTQINGSQRLLPCLFWDLLPSGFNAEILYKLNQSEIEPLKKLAMCGKNAVGALEFEPHLPYQYDTAPLNLDEIEADIRSGVRLSRQFRLSAGILGHTPKIAVKVSQEKDEIFEQTEREHFFDWLIKLPSAATNPRDGAAEYLYTKMAKNAGIEVPRVHLFASKSTAGYFGCKRFDRKVGKKIHTMTIGALMNKNYLSERIYLADYVEIVKKIAPYELENLLRLLMFNLKTGNEDIRGTGISMMLEDNTHWSLAPAYDLVPFSLEADYTPKMLKKDYEKDETDALIYDLCELAEFDFAKVPPMIEQIEDAVAEYTRMSIDLR